MFYQKIDSNIVLTTWRDKRQVNLLSSCASNTINDQGKPTSISNFNQYMGGVDLSNQLCSYYRVGKPSHKLWCYVFWFMINIAMTNAWLLFKSSVSAETLSRFPTHKKFVLALAHDLRNGFSSRKYNTGRPLRRRLPVPPFVLARQNGHELV